MTLAERIREAMGDMSAADIARATKKTPGAVTQWLDGTTKSLKAETAAMLQAATGYSASWLATGKGPKKASGNIEPVLGGQGVPFITWAQAKNWISREGAPSRDEVDVWLPCPAVHGPRAYCVRVRGDSMANPGGRPSYADGDIIFVDPDREPAAGDRVIVVLANQPEATFKQLLIEDGRRILKALNPAWAPRYIDLDDSARVVGVVIGKWVPE